MRVPSSGPVRPARRLARGRVGLVVLVAIAFVVLTSLRGIAVFYTDYLWFDELHLSSIWRGVLGAKILLAVVFTVGFFGLLWVNLFIADRLAPRFRAVGPEDELVARYRETIGPHGGKVRVGVAALFALLAGSGVAGQWHNWLLFRNGVPFGVKDPQFHKDVGFYVFDLPFISFLIDWFFVSTVIIAAVTVGAHYLNGGIRIQATGRHVTSQVKAHISVLLGALALIKAVGYWYQRYELNFSTRGAVHGATYTDVRAQLPAISLLFIISLAAFVLFLVNIRRQGWVLPVIGVGLWALISVIVGAIYPAFVQKFRVEPAENTRERPYIIRNIAATRGALGLDKMVEREFAYDEDLTPADLQANQGTIRNVRLWDPIHVKQTYQRLQEIRSYYQFNDVDIDRYLVDGQVTQTLISARELQTDDLPRDSWVNRHLQFTHGYGSILAAANAVTPDGRPQFLIEDVPPRGSPELRQPRLYYGEKLPGYSIVRTEQPEIDYPKGGGDETTTYTGKGGVELSSLVRRAALALRFSEVNFVISGLITPKSKALYLRDISDRVRTAAPFLRYDSDPYPVVLKGRLLWVQDAYTTTSRYPYSQSASTDRVPDTSGLAGDFNYVRNSVKVVIDAYDGTMTFYRIDDKDPLARTYAKAFPALFTPASEMDPELRAHLRYPEDLFRVQTNMYARYHLTDPLQFYNAGDAWHVAQDPGSGQLDTTETAIQTTPAGVVTTTRAKRMDPTYLLMRLPGEEEEDFLLLQPMVPASANDTQKNLTAFIIAKSDPDDYGEMQVFKMPQGTQIDGPAIIDSRIKQEPTISSQLSLLNREGSRVIQGNVLVLPIEESLIYVRPLYVTATSNRLPELKQVVVVYADKVVMRPTFSAALAAIFGDAPATQEQAGQPEPAAVSTDELLAQAEAAFAAADEALKKGDLGEYQRKNREGVALVRRARSAQRSTSGENRPAPSGRSTTTTTATAA